MVILIDFIGYWLHRAFHGERLWLFHAIHHSSVELDWLSAARVHPVNDIANKSLQAMIIVALGYAPVLLAGALPLFTAYAVFLHANVSWNFGALRFVLASPRFHRWHHTAAEEGREKTSPGSCRYRIPKYSKVENSQPTSTARTLRSRMPKLRSRVVSETCLR